MSNRTSFAFPFFRLAVIVALFGFLMPIFLSAQTTPSDLSRKIIYMSNYKPIPGDVYALNLDFGPVGSSPTTGSSITSYSIVLQPDMTLELPYIGTVHVGNETFADLRKRVIESIKRAVPLQFVSFSLQAPAVFDVFVYGTVSKPGQIQMTSLNRLTDVLASAGLDSGASSTRRVELIRDKKKLTFDLTRYYVFGQENEDPFLLPGDQVFVPRIKDSVVVSGAVAKPGSYEILPDDTLGTVLKLAGGMLPTALPDQIALQRVNSQNRYTEESVATDKVDTLTLQNGDQINIAGSSTTSDRITIEGAVYGSPSTSSTPQSVPGAPVRFDIPFHPGITLLDVLDLMGGPTPFAEPEKSYIIRGSTGQRMPVPDLETLWKKRSPARNMILDQGDYIVIPMKRLSVAVVGEVNTPNPNIPYVSGYTVGDYLQAVGGINPQTGDSNAIFFASTLGKLTKVGLGTEVPPGSTIVVEKNTFTNMNQFFSNLFLITGWVTSLIGVTITVINFVNTYK